MSNHDKHHLCIESTNLIWDCSQTAADVKGLEELDCYYNVSKPGDDWDKLEMLSLLQKSRFGEASETGED